jgi:preprotein translocase subunit SecF
MGLSRRERREQRKKAWKEKLSEEENASAHHESIFQKHEVKGPLGIFDRHYMKLLILPIILFVIALSLFVYHIATTGEFINKGVGLSGGLVVTIPVTSPVDIAQLQNLLNTQIPGKDFDVRSATELGVQKSVIISTSDPSIEPLILDTAARLIPTAKDNHSSETTGSALGGSFFAETTKAMIFAFIFMALVVFFAFRSVAPSVMVVSCVIIDIIETIVTVNLLGIKVSTAGIAAFLMLIGYSVDTDILLTSRVLKTKEGTVFQRIIGAAKTGLMMTATALIAVIIALVMTQNETIREIMMILLIGLIYDILNTWLTNAALLRYYMERILPRRAAAAAAREDKRYARDLEEAQRIDKELGLEPDEHSMPDPDRIHEKRD